MDDCGNRRASLEDLIRNLTADIRSSNEYSQFYFNPAQTGTFQNTSHMGHQADQYGREASNFGPVGSPNRYMNSHPGAFSYFSVDGSGIPQFTNPVRSDSSASTPMDDDHLNDPNPWTSIESSIVAKLLLDLEAASFPDSSLQDDANGTSFPDINRVENICGDEDLPSPSFIGNGVSTTYAECVKKPGTIPNQMSFDENLQSSVDGSSIKTQSWRSAVDSSLNGSEDIDSAKKWKSLESLSGSEKNNKKANRSSQKNEVNRSPPGNRKVQPDLTRSTKIPTKSSSYTEPEKLKRAAPSKSSPKNTSSNSCFFTTAHKSENATNSPSTGQRKQVVNGGNNWKTKSEGNNRNKNSAEVKDNDKDLLKECNGKVGKEGSSVLTGRSSGNSRQASVGRGNRLPSSSERPQKEFNRVYRGGRRQTSRQTNLNHADTFLLHVAAVVQSHLVCVGIYMERMSKKVGRKLLTLLIWLIHLVMEVTSLSCSLLWYYILVACAWVSVKVEKLRKDGVPMFWKALQKVPLLRRLSRWRTPPKHASFRSMIGCDKNITLPLTGDEAMKRLLACKGKDPYSILGLTVDATDEEIKRYYKRQAVLVHPDKNPMLGAEEAFKILVHSFELIGEPAKRKEYDAKVFEDQEMESAWNHFSDLMTKLQEKLDEAANAIRCNKCSGTHRRIPTDRPSFSARYCQECRTHHAARHVSTHQ